METAFRFDELDGGIGRITFDLPSAKVNTLSRKVLEELAALVAQLESRTDLTGLLFASGKPGQFIAGADLKEIAALSYITAEQATVMLEFGHRLFSQISRLPFPTVALIDGACLGGGTELVLSMDDRLVSAAAHTQVGLPEVKIGLMPGWGGTQRLPRLVGLSAAIDMIAGGEPVAADKAVTLGLAFDAVPVDRLVDEGRRRIEQLRDSGDWTANRAVRSGPVKLGPDAVAFAFAVAQGVVKLKTKGQYPAPLAALGAIKDGLALPLDQAIKVEQKAVGKLVGSPILANLIGIFFMKNRLSRGEGGPPARELARIGVLGSGLMGAGIAAACARSGKKTVMLDVDDGRLADGMARAMDVVKSRIKIGRATVDDLAALLARLTPTTNHAMLADCDLVIEAVTENEAVKREAYARLKGLIRDDAITASNTSTISITRMAEAAPNPERFVGMHFFNPVDRMELVEVIQGARTSPETIASVVELARRARKTPIVVQDCAGFLVNRVLFPYMNESLILAQEGAPIEAIDKAAARFGMPMGPMTLTDLVGLETAVFAGKLLKGAYPDRSVDSPILVDMLKQGGGGKGAITFWTSKSKTAPPRPNPVAAEIVARHRTGDHAFDENELVERLFFPMLLEATRVLEEGIVSEPGDVDMGLILGIGFPPFRGGILRWCDTLGAKAVVDRLERYQSLGKRYQPTESLLAMAKSGEAFYPRPKLTAIA